MRKKCKRKVYDLVNPIEWAIIGACIPSDNKLTVLKQREADMIDAIVNNTNVSLESYRGLCELLGVAETMAQNGIGPEVMQACEDAQVSMIKLKNRFEKWSKWDITDKELHSLRELMEWHQLQRSSISNSEYERFLKDANNRMRSRAPEVVEL